MSDDRFKAITVEDMTMPGGWSVNDGQTFLYTREERELMHQARAFAQKELLPHIKQPIAMFEGVSFKLAEMYASLDAARQVVYRTAKMVHAGVPAQRESAVTKLFVAEAVWRIVDHAMQVLGGIGYTTDFPLQAIFRSARLLRIGAGSDEIMKFLIAREVLKEMKG